ncbi:MAG: hypothetical protein ABI947_28120 [Chloroflexota bacterium]
MSINQIFTAYAAEHAEKPLETLKQAADIAVSELFARHPADQYADKLLGIKLYITQLEQQAK